MNPDMYSYSLVVALIGMTTVFVGLALLSVMMIVLRRLFAPDAPPSPVHPPKPLKVVTTPSAADDRWVVAAVAAYLDAEAREARPSALRWRPARDIRSDPWLIQRRP